MSSYPECLHDIGLKVARKYTRASDHHTLECLLCHSEFIATPKSKMQNYKKHGKRGCPACIRTDRYSDTHVVNSEKMIEMGYKLLTPYTGLYDDIKVVNTTCGCNREWITTPSGILSGRSYCKPCNDEKKIKRMHHWNLQRSTLGLKKLSGFRRYRKHVRILTETAYRDNEHELTNNGKFQRGRGKYHLDHIIPITFCYKHNIPPSVCAHPTNLKLLPEADNIRKSKTITSKIPTIFKEYITSSTLLEHFSNTVSDCIDVKMNQWEDFDFFEAPIFFPDHKIVATVVPLELYQEGNLKNKYFMKTLRDNFLEIGVRCIFVMEHEWREKQQLIIDKLKHMVGVNTCPKIYARKCVVKIVDPKNKGEFLNLHHIQGNDKSAFNIGLYHKSTLVSVMTFSPPKIFMMGRDTNRDGVFELSRFANHSEYRVIGSFSKLLKYFSSNTQFKKLFSFADLKWSDGNVYTTAGFKSITSVPPDYAYVINGTLKHRWGFRKDALRERHPAVYDEAKTEYQMMRELGYDRIWDCGKLKFELEG